MSGELLFVLLLAFGAFIVVAFVRMQRKRKGLGPMDWGRFYLNPKFLPAKSGQEEPAGSSSDPASLTTEEESAAELKRLQKLINSRKKIAWETDISYHVWNLYKNHFRNIGPYGSSPMDHNGKWYELKILNATNINDVKKVDFELSGVRYTFVDDEDRQKISENMKLFNLSLYDDKDRCLVDIPMKLRVDDTGKTYSVSSKSPMAFILDSWLKDFVNVSLKHQNIHNQEIRAQKHQERLREIEELKEKFGISD
jgi:hypothetical protein